MTSETSGPEQPAQDAELAPDTDDVFSLDDDTPLFCPYQKLGLGWDDEGCEACQ